MKEEGDGKGRNERKKRGRILAIWWKTGLTSFSETGNKTFFVNFCTAGKDLTKEG